MKTSAAAVLLCCSVLVACDPANAPKSARRDAFDPSTVAMKYRTRPGNLEAGSRTTIDVSVRNDGTTAIPAGFLIASYLWWNGKTALPGADELPLPELPPRTDVVVRVPISVPRSAQHTLLKIDLMNESGRWISDEGAFKPLHYNVDIVDAQHERGAAASPPFAGASTASRPSTH